MTAQGLASVPLSRANFDIERRAIGHYPPLLLPNDLTTESSLQALKSCWLKPVADSAEPLRLRLHAKSKMTDFVHARGILGANDLLVSMRAADFIGTLRSQSYQTLDVELIEAATGRSHDYRCIHFNVDVGAEPNVDYQKTVFEKIVPSESKPLKLDVRSQSELRALSEDDMLTRHMPRERLFINPHMDCFVLPYTALVDLYVTSQFVDGYRALGLTGLEFIPTRIFLA